MQVTERTFLNILAEEDYVYRRPKHTLDPLWLQDVIQKPIISTSIRTLFSGMGFCTGLEFDFRDFVRSPKTAVSVLDLTVNSLKSWQTRIVQTARGLKSMNEVSIWVDKVYGNLSGHSTFLRSICPLEFPNQEHHAFVKWAESRTGLSRKTQFSQSDLLLRRCKVPLQQKLFHLFVLGAAGWKAFQEDHLLTELNFQPKLAGIIVIIEKKNIDQQYKLFEDIERVKELPKVTGRLLEKLGYLSFDDNAPLTLGLWFLSWVKRHKLPFVIAATGYQKSQSPLNDLREGLQLDSDVPIIPGPSMYQENELIFDSDHTKQVLSILNEHIEMHNPTIPL